MHTDQAAPYAINKSFMDTVEAAVDWSLERGMVRVFHLDAVRVRVSLRDGASVPPRCR